MGKCRSGKKGGSGIIFNKKGSSFSILRKPQKRARTPRTRKVSKEVPIQKQEWELKVNRNDWFQGKVNVKPSDLIADTLNGRFTDEQKLMFRRTCFGHYLDMPEITINPQLIHQVLLREVNQLRENEIWFRIGNDNVKFGIDDFYLVTGLRCSGDASRKKYALKYCRLRCEYFNSLPHITIQDVFEVFTSMSNRNNRDVVLMGILFLLTNLMYSTAYERFVDETLLVLVDSPDIKIYPWGKDIFKLTFTSLQQALRNKQVTVEGEGRPSMSYRLNGFVAAFQVWIYEILPMLESKVCWKVASRRPRILNWTSEVDANVPPLNLGVDVFSRPDVHAINIVAQVTEALDPFYVAIKHKSHQLKPTKINLNTVTEIDEDDDFVIPARPHHMPTPTSSVPYFDVNIDPKTVAPETVFTENRFQQLPQVDQTTLNGLGQHIHKTTFVASGIKIDDTRNYQSEDGMKSMKGKEILIADDSSDDEYVYFVQESRIDDKKFHHKGESSTAQGPYVTDLKKTGSTSSLHFSKSPASNSLFTLDGTDVEKKNDQEQQNLNSLNSDWSNNDANLKKQGNTSKNSQADSMSYHDGQAGPKTGFNIDIEIEGGGGHVHHHQSTFRKPTSLENDHRGRKRKNGKHVQRLDMLFREAAKLECENTLLKMEVETMRDFVKNQISTCLETMQELSQVFTTHQRPNTFMEMPFRSNIEATGNHHTRNDIRSCNVNQHEKVVSALHHDLPSCNKTSNLISDTPLGMDPAEMGSPSFDLGIEEMTTKASSVVLDDELVFSEENIKQMDDIVLEVLSKSGKKRDFNYLATQSYPQIQDHEPASKSHFVKVYQPSSTSTKTGAGLITSCGNIPHKKFRPNYGKSKEISPIPFHIDKVISPVHGLTSKNQQNSSPESVTGLPSTKRGYEFIYMTCMDTPLVEDINKFNKFYQDCLKLNNWNLNFDTDVLEIRPPTNFGPIFIESDMWWHDLYEVGRPLNDRHIDVSFYYIRMLLKLKHSVKFRTTTTDCNFDVKIRGISKELDVDPQALKKHGSLFGYVQGIKIPFNIPWAEVDHVLIPMWIQSPSHWILAHFDMANWCLDIYNSYNRIIKSDIVYRAIRSMRIALPILARSMNDAARTFPDTPLKCRIIEDCPQQQNGGDCGVYVIKYAEYIIEGRMLNMSVEFDASTARKNIATQLHKYMMEEPDIIWVNSPDAVTIIDIDGKKP